MNGYFPQTIELLRSGRNSIGLLLTVVGGQGLKWQSVLHRSLPWYHVGLAPSSSSHDHGP